MQRVISFAIFAFVLCGGPLFAGSAASLKAQAQPYKKDAGPYAVEVLTQDWHDAKRDRDVPVKIYYPKSDGTSFPVIVFSHGLGGSREGYGYLGRHWASHGYVSVHVQHKGSDTEAWKGNPAQPMKGMKQAAANPMNAIARPLDVRFAIDQMERMNRLEGPLRGLLNLGEIGMAGHSFGAFTTLAVAGEVFVLGQKREAVLADPRVKAAIPMSAPVPKKSDQFDQIFGKIKIPCFHMTGTLDNSPIGETSAAERRVPFDHIRGCDQYLVTFEGGDHMIFSGRLAGRLNRKDALFQGLICMSTTAFWDAYLRGDVKAKAWLAGGGFEAVLGRDGKLEQKK